MSKRILITGAQGFLAKAMVSYLSLHVRESQIIQMVRNHQLVAGNCYACDFEDQLKLDSFLREQNPDLIFHFAGGRYPDNDATFHANVTTTRLLLAALARTNLHHCRVILPGSAAEYGNLAVMHITEDSLPQPLSWYGLVKLMQTQLGLYAARDGQDVVVARMFNILGAGTPASLAMGMFAKQIVAIEQGSQPSITTKNLDGYRDFLDIDDVCAGLWDIARQGTKGEVYNLCSMQAVTIGDLLRQMLSLSTVSGIEILENRHDASASFNVIGSCQKLQQLSGWRPMVSITQSLENTLASYRRLKS